MAAETPVKTDANHSDLAIHPNNNKDHVEITDDSSKELNAKSKNDFAEFAVRENNNNKNAATIVDNNAKESDSESDDVPAFEDNVSSTETQLETEVAMVDFESCDTAVTPIHRRPSTLSRLWRWLERRL